MGTVELRDGEPYSLPIVQDARVYAAGENIVISVSVMHYGTMETVQIPFQRPLALTVASGISSALATKPPS
jgi:NO-binding membrane sensor protein with MHYT domain